MKTGYQVLVLSALLLVSGKVAAAEIGASARMAFIEQAASSTVLHGFGGQTQEIGVVLAAAPGAVLEIEADLFQKAQSLVMPVEKGIWVGRSIVQPVQSTAPNFTKLKLPLPEVKSEALFIARFRIKTEKSEWQPAGQVLLKVYPPSGLKESLVQVSKALNLQLLGSDKRLKDFLKRQQVSFEELEGDLISLPEVPPSRTVFLVSASSSEIAQWTDTHPEWRGNLVFFVENSGLVPGVYLTSESGRRIVKVTLPLLDTLSTDPRSQTTLVEILKTVAAH